MYGIDSPACDDAKFNLWTAQCTPMVDGVAPFSCATMPFLHPIIVDAPSVPIPQILFMSSLTLSFK